jgi:hypothetical protein
MIAPDALGRDCSLVVEFSGFPVISVEKIPSEEKCYTSVTAANASGCS